MADIIVLRENDESLDNTLYGYYNMLTDIVTAKVACARIVIVHKSLTILSTVANLNTLPMTKVVHDHLNITGMLNIADDVRSATLSS